MPGIIDGNYRISLNKASFLSTGWDDRVVLLPTDQGQATTWEIRSTDGGNFTLKPAGTPKFAGYRDEPQPLQPIVLIDQPRPWRITDGPGPDTVAIAAPGTEWTLGLSPILIYPPMVALSDPFRMDGGWTLQPA